MKQQYVINTKSLVQSKLDPFRYFVLQVLFEKDEDLFEMLKINITKQFCQILVWLCDEAYIKYSGFDEGEVSLINFVNQIIIDNFELSDFVVFEKTKSLFQVDELSTKLSDIPNWIMEYRDKFKGIRDNALGDKSACIKKMQIFMKSNPTITKEDILKATDNYIHETNPQYVKQADYFIYKTGNDKVMVSGLAMYCEKLKDTSVKEEVSLNKMI